MACNTKVKNPQKSVNKSSNKFVYLQIILKNVGSNLSHFTVCSTHWEYLH